MGWTQELEQKQAELHRLEPVLQKIADEVILGPGGALARNYAASGLKQKSSLLFDGITKRGWIGNYVRTNGNVLTVGLDLRAISYAKWALEGRGPVVAKYKKALRFVIDGKTIFAKRVKAAPAHRVYYLTAEDIARAQGIVVRELGFGMRA